MTAATMTFDQLPLELTSFLALDSWLRIAASAYRLCVRTVPWHEVERVRVMNGEVFYTRVGREFQIFDSRDVDLPVGPVWKP